MVITAFVNDCVVYWIFILHNLCKLIENQISFLSVSVIHNIVFVVAAVKPTRIRIDSVTNHSAVLSWNINHPNIGCNGKETQFRVRYGLTNDDALQRAIVRETSVELANLLPFTNYTVFIVNVDTSGQNQRSDDFLFTSLPGGMYINTSAVRFYCACVVPSAPMSITTVTNNGVPTQLLITWQVCVGHF